jgi:IclR family acetate operon transcriptional repressor
MRSTPLDDANSVLERAMLILGAFSAQATELKLRDLVELTKLPKPTVHRLAKQLEAEGYLERVEGRGAYRIGLKLFSMGQRAPRQRWIVEASSAHLWALHFATGETVSLAIPDGTEVLHVDRVAAAAGPQLASEVGGRMPAYCTAVGKATLAFAADDVVEAVVRAPLKRRTPYTICAPGRLIADIETVRKTRLAFNREESMVGVVCAAVPVLGPRATPLAAISVSGRTNRFDLRRAASALHATSAAISKQLAIAAQQSYKLRRSLPESSLGGYES